MQTHNKPGRKLTPELKASVDPIYRRDPQRYNRLCLFVWKQQQRGFSDEAIAACLGLASAHLDAAPNWWAYLSKLMPKSSAKAFEIENNANKKGDLTAFRDILRQIIK